MKRYLFTAILALAFTLPLCAQNWAPAGDRLKTRWAGQVDPKCPLPEYPRPQMVRPDWINLNGLWDYSITKADGAYAKPDGKILVPFCVESSLSGVQKSITRDDALWYERTFTVPAKWRKQNILLHFGACDWSTEVWVNGTKVGEHTGGYAPFTFDITKALTKSGKQTLRVKVRDASDNGYQPRGKQCLSPRGIWYTATSGIWQTVWLEPVNKTAHIASYNAVWDGNTLSIDVNAEGDYDQIKAVLKDGSAVVGDGLQIAVDNPKLWSPSSPNIYGLEISLLKKGKPVDKVEGYTCLRTVSMKKDEWAGSHQNAYKRLALNGERIFMFGPLDQGYWPDGIFTAPTDEALKSDIIRTKELGFNMIRKHVKVEPARWYYWCDVLGMLVWQDMPCIADPDRGNSAWRDPEVVENSVNWWSGDSFVGGSDCKIPQEWKDNYYHEWGEIIDALKQFQCIAVWVPFNEAWGQFDTPEVVAFTRAHDATRLVNEASGGNFHFVGDIIDVHHYSCPAMNAFDHQFINVLGEYGGIGFPVKGHMWIDSSDNWGYSYGKDAQGLQDLYDEFGEMLKVFIKTGCSAAVYTQTTDVELESNGLMTYDREIIKFDVDHMKAVNRSIIGTLK